VYVIKNERVLHGVFQKFPSVLLVIRTLRGGNGKSTITEHHIPFISAEKVTWLNWLNLLNVFFMHPVNYNFGQVNAQCN
jgi:hypothetical protein